MTGYLWESQLSYRAMEIRPETYTTLNCNLHLLYMKDQIRHTFQIQFSDFIKIINITFRDIFYVPALL